MFKPTKEELRILRAIGERVQYLRKKRKKTQNELGLAMDWDRANIRRIERGRLNLTARTLIKLTKALDIKFSELFRGIK